MVWGVQETTEGSRVGDGRQASPSPDWFWQCWAVWQARARSLRRLDGFHESLPLTNTMLQADKANVSVHQAVLTLPVQTLRHQALASILPDI